jgi:hypothetical protein
MKSDKYQQTWFDFDWKQKLITENVPVIDGQTSKNKLSSLQKQAMEQYQPNSTLIPLLLLGIPPNPIYQLRPTTDDDFDQNPDVDEMPDHLADGNDLVDYTDIARKTNDDVKQAHSAYKTAKERFEEAQKRNKEAVIKSAPEKTTA